MFVLYGININYFLIWEKLQLLFEVVFDITLYFVRKH